LLTNKNYSAQQRDFSMRNLFLATAEDYSYDLFSGMGVNV
jgi:hypothetical protein